MSELCQGCSVPRWRWGAVADGVGCSQGVVPATVFLDRGDLETQELGHASLSRLIRPIIDAGAPE